MLVRIFFYPTKTDSLPIGSSCPTNDRHRQTTAPSSDTLELRFPKIGCNRNSIQKVSSRYLRYFSYFPHILFNHQYVFFGAYCAERMPPPSVYPRAYFLTHAGREPSRRRRKRKGSRGHAVAVRHLCFHCAALLKCTLIILTRSIDTYLLISYISWPAVWF